jgi:acetyl esterase/lipase
MRTHVIASLCLLASFADPLTETMAIEPTYSDIEYAVVGKHRLRLDIYQPTATQKPPLIVWVHGGAWRAGSRNSVPIRELVGHGFTIASVDYRLSPVAKFPAQVHDIKAAIRFLRANAEEYKFDTREIFIAGASAGGHLAALVGVTNGVKELEGNVGEHLGESSDVQRIVSFYGASNLQTILSQSTPHGLSVRKPALDLLLGGQPDAEPERARLASPVAHVDRTDPPLLLIHGDQDPQMPINQAHELHGRYKAFGLPIQFEVVHGAAHGGRGFYESEMLNRVAEYLKTGTLTH